MFLNTGKPKTTGKKEKAKAKLMVVPQAKPSFNNSFFIDKKADEAMLVALKKRKNPISRLFSKDKYKTIGYGPITGSSNKDFLRTHDLLNHYTGRKYQVAAVQKPSNFKDNLKTHDAFLNKAYVVSNQDKVYGSYKEASIEQGFLKAAMAAGLSEGEATDLYKLSLDPTVTKQHSEYVSPAMTGGLMGAGAGGLTGGLLGAGIGAGAGGVAGYNLTDALLPDKFKKDHKNSALITKLLGGGGLGYLGMRLGGPTGMYGGALAGGALGTGIGAMAGKQQKHIYKSLTTSYDYKYVNDVISVTTGKT